MKSFENIDTITDSEDEAIEKNIESNPEKTEAIKNYWRKYGFAGTPPKADSVAEKRLINACEEYASYLLTLASINFGDSTALARGSDEKRRELHNNISIMITGSQRSGMEKSLADKIADFAARLTYGTSINEVIEEQQKFREEN
jgi:hypothetical protein